MSAGRAALFGLGVFVLVVAIFVIDHLIHIHRESVAEDRYQGEDE